MTAHAPNRKFSISGLTWSMVAAAMALIVLASNADAAPPASTKSVKTSTFVLPSCESMPNNEASTRHSDRENHPEVGTGPPASTLRQTAVRPDVVPLGGFSQPQDFRRTPSFDDFGTQPVNWNRGGVPFPGVMPAPSNEKSPESPGVKISARAQDPRMAGYLSRTSMNQLASLFAESSRLVDTRHVSPPTYEKRTADALLGLAEAVGNPEFLAANRVNPSAAAIRSLQQELSQMAQSQPARSSTEALGLMQWAAELGQQRLGIRREAMALEFLNATLDSLDKHSAFMPAKSSGGPSASLDERIVGIGVELKTAPEGVLVTGVIDNSPASGAGLRKGDVIVAVDGRNLGGMGLGQAADYIGGPQGSTVRLTILRQGQTFNATMQRRSVYVSSVVDAKFLDSQRKVGYLRLKQFSESTSQDLLKEMWALYNAGMDSLVLDLRGNPGGLLSQAVEVSDIFVPGGKIVETRGRTASDNSDFQAKRANTWKIPLVVLIDDHSASASEIFAAAIQENGRGVVVGRTSYGKGTVQTHFPLQAAAGELKLTTAKFYSPTGREMAGAGVTPDYTVPTPPGAMDVDETRDPDLIAAVRVIQTGRPAQLAEAAGRTGQQLGGLGHGR